MMKTRRCPTLAGAPATGVAAAALLVVATLAPSVSHAQRALAHRPADSATGGLLERPARLQVSNLSLEEALKRLAERSAVDLAFSPTRIPRDLKVSCPCREVNVTRALDLMLART